MSQPPERAVFLSYASQDAGAAKRICDALRQAGVEVWFDQNELVGGDAWDAKIRKQIKDCALFVPIISANTQARTEGYFRLEWRIADQRTHLMARNRPFLLPVVIDATRDAEANVPDSFTEVQWTRLSGGETPPAFCARVQKLLADPVETGRPRPVQRDEGVASPMGAKVGRRVPAAAWAIAAVVALCIAAFSWSRRNETSLPPNAGAGTRPPTPEKSAPPTVSTASSAEVARIRARLVPDRWQKGDFEALSPTLDRLILANPEDSDAWALRSIINSMQVSRNFDSGTKPLEVGRGAAERALRLAPESPLAELALGLHLNAMISRGGDPLAGRPHVSRAVAAMPPDALTRFADLISSWQAYDIEGTQRVANAWLAAEPKATYPAWILAQLYITLRRPVDAEKWAEAAAADRYITGTRALYTLFESKYFLRADLGAAEAALDRVPPEGRAVHRVIHARWLLAMAEHHWDEALQELARVPEPMLYDRTFHGPRALLAGLAHQRAGRADAALAQFHQAERLLRSELVTDAENEELHLVLAVTLACAGRAADARSELALVEPLLKGQAPSIYWGAKVVAIAQAYGTIGDYGRMAEWLRKLFVERSGFPVTPSSLKFDPRFFGTLDAPEIQALLKEFASLDQPQVTASVVAPDNKSVAVLAFANLSDDKDNEYFSDGISEELLNVLAKVPGLKVSARTSAFYFKGKQVPIPEIAQKLGVAYVVEGSVRKSGSKVRITAQLIKAEDGFHVWSDNFDRELKDIFVVQDEIAGLIAKNLQLKMGITTARPTIDLEAYQKYLAGRAAVEAGTTTSAREGIEHFRTAVRLDPKFTAAWVQIARTYVHLSRWGGLLTETEWQDTQRAMDRAVALEPNSPEVWLALGWVRRTADWNWHGAEQALREAMRLRPDHAETQAALGVLLANLGREEEAVAMARRAAELDPLNAATQMDLLSIFYSYGRFAEAVEAGRRAIQLVPGGQVAHSWLAMGLVGLRRFPEAEAEAALEPEPFARQAAQIMIATKQGRMTEARGLLQEYEKRAEAAGGAWNSYAYLAFLFGHIGQAAKGVDALEMTRKIHDPSIAWTRTSFYADVLHTDPRWPEFLRRVGLADDQLK